MGIKTSGPNSNNEFIISITGNFDFNLVNAFRQSYTSISNQDLKVIVDMRGVTYMDSSGLGMLLNLRRAMGSEQADISIINGSQQVNKILLISRFDKKFKIK